MIRGETMEPAEETVVEPKKKTVVSKNRTFYVMVKGMDPEHAMVLAETSGNNFYEGQGFTALRNAEKMGHDMSVFEIRDDKGKEYTIEQFTKIATKLLGKRG